MGARKSHSGARYNFGGVLSVYLADTVETCLAEKMFCQRMRIDVVEHRVGNNSENIQEFVPAQRRVTAVSPP
jgi:RES domain-containing protein